MGLKKFIISRKLLLINLIFAIYVATNLIGGERGILSYFEKLNYLEKIKKEEKMLNSQLNKIETKNKLLSDDLDVDFVDTLYREKLKFGKPGEIIIKLDNEK